MQLEADHLRTTLNGALKKLKDGMDEGPFGPDISLTAEESCLLYRVLTEQLGLKLPE